MKKLLPFASHDTKLSLPQLYYERADIAILVFDNLKTGGIGIETWLERLQEHVPDIPLALVNNKYDFKDAQMPENKLNFILERYKIIVDQIFPTSCLTNRGIPELRIGS